MTESTNAVENTDQPSSLDHLGTPATPAAPEVAATAETPSSEVAPTTENSAAAETSNAPVTEGAPATENTATAETSNAPAQPEAPKAEETPETADPKLCGTDPKIICDVVHGLFSEPKTAEVKPEEPTRSLEFQTTKVVSSNVVPKVPVQYVENPLKFAKDLKKPTALDKIKDVAANLKLMGKEAEGEFIVKAFDNITNPTLERKEFEIKDTEELAKAFFGRDAIAPKNPGSLNSNTFTISENAETNPTGKSFQDNNAGTVTDKVIDSAYGTIAAQVNFDMLQELRERVYHAKFELDKVVGVKGELFDSLNCSLKKAEEILNVERSNIVKHNLEEITKTLEAVKVEDLAPEDRKAVWDSIHNLKCAINLVNKSGFKDKAGDAEKLVQEQVAKALKIYPKLKEDVRMQALSSQIFALSE